MAASVRLISDKKYELTKAQRLKGFNRQGWSYKAMVSESTLKRFLKGEAVSIDCFRSLCKAVGIEEWKEFVDWEVQDSTRQDSTRVVPTSPANFSEVDLSVLKQSEQSETKKSSIVISGSFSEDDRQEIEAVLDHLKSLLVKHTVTIR